MTPPSGMQHPVPQGWLRRSHVIQFLTMAAATMLGLAGCVSLAPPYNTPPLPVALVYPEPAPVTPSATAPVVSLVDWRDYFSDAYLKNLISQGLEHNRDLRTAILRVTEARAAYSIQRSTQFPAIGASVGASRSRTPGNLNLTGQALISNDYQVGLDLGNWELDFWGRVHDLKDAALENFLATDDARRAFTMVLVEQIADGYLTLRELDERVTLAQRTISSRQESFRIFKRRFEVGAISKLDLILVETLLTQAQALGAQLEQSRAAQVHLLTQLIGVPVESLSQEQRFDDASLLQEPQVGLPSGLLTARPDIIAAEHQLRAAHANIGAARAAFFPRIALTGNLGSASAELQGLFQAGSGAWSFTPSIVAPIFDGGRNRAGLDLAEVRRDLAVANYEKTVQTAFREVSDALSARLWLSEQVRIQQAALAAQNERSRLAKLRYDNGASPYLEVLDAQRDLLVAEQQLVQTRRALLSSKIRLYTALGGGAAALSHTDISVHASRST
jgi:multidrug efflux system outer membrane protein